MALKLHEQFLNLAMLNPEKSNQRYENMDVAEDFEIQLNIDEGGIFSMGIMLLRQRAQGYWGDVVRVRGLGAERAKGRKGSGMWALPKMMIGLGDPRGAASLESSRVEPSRLHD